jgi:L-lactate dehydrogenase (cytochrome)
MWRRGSAANRDPALNWDDIKWFRKQTKIPIVIKGVQTGEDAVLAAKAGVAAIILSNHGGRNCDTSRSGIEVLPEAVAALKDEGLRQKVEVWVDGGVRRGTDVLKAVVLGADAVGLGKPAVFAMSAFGEEGIVKMLSILEEELVMAMRLAGTPTLADLNPRLVDAASLNRHTDCAPIPPSPYAYMAPVKNVRSPDFPTLPQVPLAAAARPFIANLRVEPLNCGRRLATP